MTDSFGTSLALSDRHALVCDIWDGAPGHRIGAAFAFDLDTLPVPEPADPDLFRIGDLRVEESLTAADVVATIHPTDVNRRAITYTLTGAGAAAFEITRIETRGLYGAGALRFKTAPDFESGKTSYAITIVATDDTGRSTRESITIEVENAAEAVEPDKSEQTLLFGPRTRTTIPVLARPSRCRVPPV